LSPFYFCCLWCFYQPPHVGALSNWYQEQLMLGVSSLSNVSGLLLFFLKSSVLFIHFPCISFFVLFFMFPSNQLNIYESTWIIWIQIVDLHDFWFTFVLKFHLIFQQRFLSFLVFVLHFHSVVSISFLFNLCSFVLCYDSCFVYAFISNFHHLNFHFLQLLDENQVLHHTIKLWTSKWCLWMCKACSPCFLIHLTDWILAFVCSICSSMLHAWF